MWSRDNLWELNAWYCCTVKSEQPQPSLHKEAASLGYKYRIDWLETSEGKWCKDM